MRVFLRRFRRRQRPANGPGSCRPAERPTNHRPMHGLAGRRAAVRLPLAPWQVRQQRFGWTPFGRRGLDPQEVWDFLDRVADDLAAVHEALRQSREETARIKVALCRWQSAQARVRNEREWRR